MAEDQQRKLQELTDAYQKTQDDLQTTILARQKLTSQQTETKQVQSEFADLAEDSQIYKMVGPVLLKQDRSEATTAVEARLEFIEKEIKRVEDQIGDLTEKGEMAKLEVLKAQSGLQQQQQQVGAA